MLIDAAVQEIGESARQTLKAKAGRKYPSYVLAERIRTKSTELPFQFGTSSLAVAETIRVILDEYIKRKIDDKGIPFQYWESVIKQERLSEKDQEDLFYQVQHFFIVFRTPSPRVPRVLLKFHEAYNLADIHVLITADRLSITDAFLVGQALHGSCTYFVSEDQPLRKILNKAGRIQAVAAQTMLGHIN